MFRFPRLLARRTDRTVLVPQPDGKLFLNSTFARLRSRPDFLRSPSLPRPSSAPGSHAAAHSRPYQLRHRSGRNTNHSQDMRSVKSHFRYLLRFLELGSHTECRPQCSSCGVGPIDNECCGSGCNPGEYCCKTGNGGSAGAFGCETLPAAGSTDTCGPFTVESNGIVTVT